MREVLWINDFIARRMVIVPKSMRIALNLRLSNVLLELNTRQPRRKVNGAPTRERGDLRSNVGQLIAQLIDLLTVSWRPRDVRN